jgi:hypothetical protein
MENVVSTARVESNLCIKCQKVVNQLEDAYEYGGMPCTGFCEDSSQMNSRAEGGCLLCSQILTVIESNHIPEPAVINELICTKLVHKKDKEMFIFDVELTDFTNESWKVVMNVFRQDGKWP